ncbi:zinc ribbon domain-containing protein [Acetivibrio cellulolyticus]|uniref:hypothetical protein n=1 Tax=Acetivibrio cellulolyticus TaxID=35830 RepID=UPI0001E2E69E|nr:hypothetical protein [Acetivibrio cellulolyticus]
MIFVLAFLFFVLYHVVRAAIDDTEMAKDIKFIRNALDNNFASSNNEEEELELEDNFQLLNVAYDICPACKEKISPQDVECPHCRITLSNNKDI